MGERYDMVIVGGGLAGLAAARRAGLAGLRCLVLSASPGSLPYTSGALDLLGVYPTETKRYRDQPWEALSELIEREPHHPYGRVGLGRVRQSLDSFCDYLEAGPLAYSRLGERNLRLISAVGTIKPTFAVPASLRSNCEALSRRRPTLIVGLEGFPSFSAVQVVNNLRDRWPGLRAARIDVRPLIGADQRLNLFSLAAAFERPEFRAAVAELLAPLVGKARHLGLPAVLGVEGVVEACADLSQRLGAEVFEIPLISPSLPGQRLGDLLRRDLISKGIRVWQGAAVDRIVAEGRRVKALRRAGKHRAELIEAEHFVLATGRFFGGGMEASQDGVRDRLLDIDLGAPTSRDDWHMGTFLGAPGHPINRVGVEVDTSLRPLGADGAPLYDNLFVAGAMLAAHDWVREKSGAGISIATGHAAVEAALELGAR